MRFIQTPLEGAYEVFFEPIADKRGWFARVFCKEEFKKIGFAGDWVQMNHSFTTKIGTVRGMHFQFPPFREVKFVRCIAGAVLDVIVDLRKSSNTFMHHVAIELSPSKRNSLFIPEGFAHGFQVLADNTELIYLHSALYAAGHEGGLRYDDPLLNIKWPLDIVDISDRDISHPLINESFIGI